MAAEAFFQTLTISPRLTEHPSTSTTKGYKDKYGVQDLSLKS